MSELKACPFCGTSVVGIEYDGLYRWVECGNMDCSAAGKVFAFLTDVGNADHIVANNWNTRPIEDKLTAELARRDEIISRLKEDGDSLASVVTGGVTQDAEEYWECPYCMAMAYNAGDIHHTPDCPITLHCALMKELE